MILKNGNVLMTEDEANLLQIAARMASEEWKRRADELEAGPYKSLFEEQSAKHGKIADELNDLLELGEETDDDAKAGA